MRAYRFLNVKLVKLPPHSPDLNPVEKMWGWIRKQLRKRDLLDMKKKRPVLGRIAYRMRIRRLIASRRAQNVAEKFATNFLTVCKKVCKSRGKAVAESSRRG